MTDDLPEIISEQLDKHMPAPQKPHRRPAKPWYASKTIWAQIIGAAISILMLVMASPAFEQYAVYASLAINALTIVLRVLVDQPIEGGPKA